MADRLKLTKAADWAAESHQVAIDAVYDGITPGAKPSENYISRGRKVVDEQLVVAGYRLADIIVEAYAKRVGSVEALLAQ